MSAEPVPERIVKPARRHTEYLPLIAVSMEDNAVRLEGWTGEFTLGDLPGIVAGEPPSMIVTGDPARLLVLLNQTFDDRDDWQYRVTPERRDIRPVNGGGVKRQRVYTTVNFFGFRPPEKSKKKGRYHYPISPFAFAATGIHEIVDREDPVTECQIPRVEKLLIWGDDVREFCRAKGIRVAPTNGGLAGQLLRHPDFFPEARRKVPRATNARARATLPGNYYKLLTVEGKPHRAWYLDMKSAHHNIAASLAFPDPDTLRARGHFTVTDATDGTDSSNRAWVKHGGRAFQRIMDDARGLLYVNLTVPTVPIERFPPPYMERPGTRMAWVYTNELPMIRELGGVVNWITAAWVSFHESPGLSKYAEWAMEELRKASDERKRWLKVTLLATYGVLAARPRIPEFGFRHAKNGVPREYPAGSGMLKVQARVGDREQEVPTANVIYRGMIEAEQRSRSLAMARDLQSRGIPVLAVYADSVFIEATDALPLMPEPWSIQEELDDLRFLSSTSFTSTQLTKMPGVPRESLDRLRTIEEHRGYRAFRPGLR